MRSICSRRRTKSEEKLKQKTSSSIWDDTNHLMPIGGEWVAAEVHHVVGGDRGWDPLSGVGSWSSGRSFNVGDKLWVTYSAAQESISELKNEEEFEACDVSNPIKMYTDGIDRISLDREGTRYFVSSNAELQRWIEATCACSASSVKARNPERRYI